VAEVANRLANLYIEENLKAREKQAGDTEAFIDNRLKEAKTKAGRARICSQQVPAAT
jgi:hypothetical protein